MSRVHWTVRQRLLGVVVLAMAGFGGLLWLAVGLVSEVRIGGALDPELRTHARLRWQLTVLRAEISEIRVETSAASRERDPDRQRTLRRRAGDLVERIEGRFRAMDPHAREGDLGATIASARATWADLADATVAAFDRLAAGATLGDDVLAMHELRAERFADQVDSAMSVLALEDDALEGAANRTVDRRMQVLVLAGVGFSLTIVVATLLITRSVTRPLRHLADTCARVASGDLDARVERAGPDELGDVARAFDAMVGEVSRSHAALREAETRYRSVFEHAQDGMFRSSADGAYLMANVALAQIYGFDSPDDLMEAMRDIGGHLYVDPGRRAELVRLIERDGGVRQFESEVYTNDGRIIWITESARGVTGEHGRLAWFEGSVRDITERKQLDQVKSDFVSFATHQLRTPLAGIKWMLELAATDARLAEDTASYLGDAHAAADRLVGLVNDLLDVARLESGRLKLVPTPTDLTAVTGAVLEEFGALAHDKGQRVSLCAPPDVPPVMVDGQLICQAVMNLVSNAIKYTPAGGEIAVRIAVDGDSVVWAIEDTGIGVPAAARSRLFEKFFRADNVHAIETEGTGLGLYLVRLIVEQSGGRVWCESQERKGSMFTIVLPAPAAAARAA